MSHNYSTVRGYHTNDKAREYAAQQSRRMTAQARIDAAVKPVIDAMGVDAYQRWVDTWADDITIEQIERISADMLASLSKCECNGLRNACQVCSSILETAEIPF